MGTQMYTNTDDQRVKALDSRIMSRGQSWGDHEVSHNASHEVNHRDNHEVIHGVGLVMS